MILCVCALPVMRGMQRTKIQMVAYITAFLAVAALLTLYGYTGYLYLSVVTFLGLAWLGLALKGLNSNNDRDWGKQMFQLSLVLIVAMCVVIPFDVR